MQNFLTDLFNTAAIVSLVYFSAAFALHVRRRQQSVPVVTAPPVAMTITSDIPPEIAAPELVVIPAPIPAAAKTMQPAIKFTIPDADVMPVVASEAIDWDLWGVRDLRWVAPRLGIKGAGHMNKATALAAVRAAIA